MLSKKGYVETAPKTPKRIILSIYNINYQSIASAKREKTIFRKKFMC